MIRTFVHCVVKCCLPLEPVYIKVSNLLQQRPPPEHTLTTLTTRRFLSALLMYVQVDVVVSVVDICSRGGRCQCC